MTSAAPTSLSSAPRSVKWREMPEPRARLAPRPWGGGAKSECRVGRTVAGAGPRGGGGAWSRPSVEGAVAFWASPVPRFLSCTRARVHSGSGSTGASVRGACCVRLFWASSKPPSCLGKCYAVHSPSPVPLQEVAAGRRAPCDGRPQVSVQAGGQTLDSSPRKKGGGVRCSSRGQLCRFLAEKVSFFFFLP